MHSCKESLMYQETAMTQDDHYQIALYSRILTTMTFANVVSQQLGVST